MAAIGGRDHGPTGAAVDFDLTVRIITPFSRTGGVPPVLWRPQS